MIVFKMIVDRKAVNILLQKHRFEDVHNRKLMDLFIINVNCIWQWEGRVVKRICKGMKFWFK